MAVDAKHDTRIDDGLQRLLPLIVDEMQPLQVWLFGSRAEGRGKPDSDYDLLVVLNDDATTESLDPVKAWRLSDMVGVPADIIPCTQSEFEGEKSVLDSLPRAAWLRGRRVYER